LASGNGRQLAESPTRLSLLEQALHALHPVCGVVLRIAVKPGSQRFV
jgi:hypothetical protein